MSDDLTTSRPHYVRVDSREPVLTLPVHVLTSSLFLKGPGIPAQLDVSQSQPSVAS